MIKLNTLNHLLKETLFTNGSNKLSKICTYSCQKRPHIPTDRSTVEIKTQKKNLHEKSRTKSSTKSKSTGLEKTEGKNILSTSRPTTS